MSPASARLLLFVMSYSALSSAYIQSAHAQAHGPLGRCAEQLRTSARNQGAVDHGTPVRDFMMTTEQRSYPYRLPADTCMHFIVAGHRHVQDLDLTIYDPSGRKLAADAGRTANPHARFCGHRGRDIVVHLEMIDGNGEFELSAMAGGPKRLHAIEQLVGGCATAGSPRPVPLDVGPEPSGPPLDQALTRLALRLTGEGFRETSATAYGTLDAPQRQAQRLELAPRRCYALGAVGSSGVLDLDMRVFVLEGEERLVAADTSHRRWAVAKLCTEAETRHLVDVRVSRGAGTYVLRAFELADAAQPPAGVRGRARVGYHELAGRMRRAGFDVRNQGWGLVRPLTGDRRPLRLRAGECVAVGAVGSEELADADLDLSLLDGHGTVVSTRLGSGRAPLLYHCAKRTEVFRAVARASELRTPGRYLLLVGRQGRPGVRP